MGGNQSNNSAGVTILVIMILLITGVLGTVLYYTARDLSNCKDNSELIKNLQEQAVKMNQTITSQQAQIEKLQADLAGKDTEIANLQKALADAQSAAQHAAGTVADLEKEREQLQDRVSELVYRQDQLQYDLAVCKAKPQATIVLPPPTDGHVPNTVMIIAILILVVILLSSLIGTAGYFLGRRNQTNIPMPPSSIPNGQAGEYIWIRRTIITEMVALLRKHENKVDG